MRLHTLVGKLGYLHKFLIGECTLRSYLKAPSWNSPSNTMRILSVCSGGWVVWLNVRDNILPTTSTVAQKLAVTWSCAIDNHVGHANPGRSIISAVVSRDLDCSYVFFFLFWLTREWNRLHLTATMGAVLDPDLNLRYKLYFYKNVILWVHCTNALILAKLLCFCISSWWKQWMTLS